MKNKQLLLVVAGLALVTLLIVGLANSSFRRSLTHTLMPGSMPGDMTSDMVDTAPSQVMHGEDSLGRAPAQLDTSAQRGAPEPLIYPSPPYYSDDALDVDERVYLYSASHDVVVNNVSAYLGDLRDYLTNLDGRVLSYSVQTRDDISSGSLRAQVPVDSFEQARSQVTNNVEAVVRENVNSQDVTGQVVNREERVASLQEQLDEKRAELAGLNPGTSAYVQVQAQIDRLEQQLEQAQDDQEQLEQNIQYSTIYVSAADDRQYFDPDSRQDPLTELQQAIESLGDSLIALGYLLIWVVVYAVIWLPVVLAVRWGWRKFR